MENTCPSCYSCGMPLRSVSDFALGDVDQKFCSHCTDAQGKLKPYEVILTDTASYLAHSQGLAMTAATEMAKGLLAAQPYWKGQHA